MARQPNLPGLGPGLIGRLTTLFGSDTVKAILIWQVAAQIFQPILAPVVAEIQQTTLEHFPDIPLSPAESAAAVVKSHESMAAGIAEAAKSGLDEERFRLLVSAIQNPPGVGELLELLRRGVIPEQGSGADSVSYEQGVREGQTGNKWIGPLKELLYQLPSPASALRAYLEGQTDEATARDLYAKWGGKPEYFELLFNTEGSAPSPIEAAEMARRGIIAWEGEGAGVTSYRQAFLEGPWRNKWEKPYRVLAEYIPPPRATTAMLRNGSITDAQAAQFYAWAGANAEVTAALLADAHHRRVASDHELAKSEVEALYYDRLVSREQAGAMLAGLKYGAENVAFLLDLTDFRREKALLDKATAKIANLYIGHKITKQAALDGLGSLGLAPESRDHLLLFWEQERTLNVKLLTPAEIANAAFRGFMTAQEAWLELTEQGYSDRDANIFLALHKVAGPQAPPGA